MRQKRKEFTLGKSQEKEAKRKEKNTHTFRETHVSSPIVEQEEKSIYSCFSSLNEL